MAGWSARRELSSSRSVEKSQTFRRTRPPVRSNIVGVMDAGRYPIPARLNLLLAALQFAATLTILSLASRATTPAAFLVPLLLFPFVAQLGFCLTHESIHNKLHPDEQWNAAAGTLLMTLFPGSYHFLKVAHLTHHRRNRTDAELEDYVLPGENAFLKRLQYYALICGLFWLLIPLSSIGLALMPKRRILIHAERSDAPMWLRFAAFMNSVDLRRVRIDGLITAIVWLTSWRLLHLQAAAVVACYIAFAFSWASQQYIYHVRTPLDIVEGALDLRLWRPMEVLYLNFNYHLTHHRAVGVPWIHLRGLAEERPSRKYFRTYLQLWQPPQRLVMENESHAEERTEIRIAKASDNAGLLALTHATPMKGSITLRIDRQPDFFRLTDLRGDSMTFVAARGERVIGCISASRQKCFVGGVMRDVFYIADLKIDPEFAGTPTAFRLLRSLGGAVRATDVDLAITVISHGNARAVQLLDGRLGLPRWQSAGSFHVAELLPRAFKPRGAYVIRPAAEEDAPSIAKLINDVHCARELAAVVSAQDVIPGERSRPIVALIGGEVVAAIVLYDVNDAKQNVVIDASPSVRLSLRLLQAGELLLRSFRAPRIARPIRVLYVRWPACKPQHPGALHQLIEHARRAAYVDHYSFAVVGFHERDPMREAATAFPRLTFRSDAYVASLGGSTDLGPILRGTPCFDYAIV